MIFIANDYNKGSADNKVTSDADIIISDIIEVLEAEGIEYTCPNEENSEGSGKHAQMKDSDLVLVYLNEEVIQSEKVENALTVAQDMKKKRLVLVDKELQIPSSWLWLIGNSQAEAYEGRESIVKLIPFLNEGADRFEVRLKEDRKFCLMRDDFSNNMKKIIEENDDLTGMIFAIGLDTSADLAKSTNSGILSHVIKLLNDSYNVTMEELQKKIDGARGTEGCNERPPMKYGETVLVEINATGKTTNLLLIANSTRIPGEDRIVEADIDQREVIIKVFKSVKELGERTGRKYDLVIGAIGTGKALRYPYEVITTEIVNCYSYANLYGHRKGSDPKTDRKDISPYNLYYSVRKEDIENSGKSWGYMYWYVKKLFDYYTDWEGKQNAKKAEGK